MLQRLIACVALACALFATRGLTQTPPAQCVHNLRIETDRQDLYIMPGVVNCISCNIAGDIVWQIEVDGDLVVTTSPTAAQIASTENNYLIIAMPEDYVLPGTSGRQDILCSAPAGSPSLEARLASPILQEPLFNDVTIREGETLTVTCITRNIQDITTSQILDPSGVAVPSAVGVFTVENAMRNVSGVYTCLVTNTLNNNTINATSTVVVEFAPEVTARNNTMTRHEIILGEELRLSCGYVGVPGPTVQFFQNDSMLLMDGMNGATIIGGAPSDNEITLVISAVGRMSGGTYTCRAMNDVGMDEVVYSVIILVPAEPVTNLMVTGFNETSVSLSWMTGFNGFTPITEIEILVTPERGDPPSTNPVSLLPSNQTIISNLLPFREHEFSVVVLNRAGTSERRNITASTLSLQLGVPTNLNFVAVSSTSLRFTWEPPTFDPDTTDDPNFYLVQFSRINGQDLRTFNVSASDPRMLQFDNLAKGTVYVVRVVAVNDVGSGNFSNLVQEETLVDPPSMPENFMVSGVGAMALFANWTAPADNGGRPLSAYRVIIDSIGFSQMIADPGITSLLIRDNQLVENTAYTVLVSAANEQGFGPNATDMERTQSILEPQTIFDLPQSDRGQSTNSSAMITWVNPGGTVDYYVIQYVLAREGFDSNSVVTVLVGPNDTSVTIADENLLPGATYSFRIAVNNSRGLSAFSPQGRFETLRPDPAIITASHTNPVLEGTTVLLNCSATLRGTITYSWTKDSSTLSSDQQFEINSAQGYLRIPMVTEDSAGMYVCTARISEQTATSSAPYSLEIQPMEPTEESGIDQNVIIIVASVGGAALLIFVIVVIFAVACLCKMKAKSSKSSYAMKPMKSKDRSNANWIETSTQFVPATGNQASNTTDGDRLAFDYSVDLQTHSSFNTLEKQKVHSTANGSDQPPPPSYSTDNATDV